MLSSFSRSYCLLFFPKMQLKRKTERNKACSVFFSWDRLWSTQIKLYPLLSHIYCTLQVKGQWKSNINVWFRFMYSQKWDCSVSLFPKQNYNVMAPNFHIHVSVSDLYSQDRSAYFAAAKYADCSWEYTNRSQIYEYRNWEQGRAASFLGMHK